MARTRNYDREEVLEKAASVFWGDGFEATSMSTLVEATGLNSASMYKEFGSKEGLYEAALVHYREKWLEQLIGILVRNPNLKGVKQYLKALLENATKPDFKGCLMINTLAEINVVGQGAVSSVEKFCFRLETLLENALRNAQKQGEIPSSRNPQTLSRYIICFMHGLVLYGRLEDNRQNVPKIVRMLMEQVTG